MICKKSMFFIFEIRNQRRRRTLSTIPFAPIFTVVSCTSTSSNPFLPLICATTRLLKKQNIFSKLLFSIKTPILKSFLLFYYRMRTTSIARLAASRCRLEAGTAVGAVKTQTPSDKLNTQERATYARVSGLL